jgi:hypothetical protein
VTEQPESPHRDELVGVLLRELPTPEPRESFWRELDETINGDAKPPSQRRRPRVRITRATLVTVAIGMALAAAAVAGIAKLGAGGSPDSSCAALLYWHGHTYRGTKVNGPSVLTLSARPIGVAQLPACADVPDQTGHSRNVNVYRLVGLPVSRAIAVRGQPGVEYVRDSGT